MTINPGDVCQIYLDTKNGVRHVKALLVEQNDCEYLWLLLFFPDPNKSDPLLDNQIRAWVQGKPRNLGYSPISSGNLLLLGKDSFELKLGEISSMQLDLVLFDIFEAKVAWKLERVRSRQTSGINFWVNLCEEPLGKICRAF